MYMKHRMYVLIILALVPVTQVFSQGNDSCSNTIKELQARIEKLEKSQKSLVSVSGQIFGSYSYSTFGTNGKEYNKFDLDRSYITVRGSIADRWSMQLTTDLYRGADTNTYYKGFGVRMKFAYLEYSPDKWSWRFGLIPGPFHSVEELAWKYRGVAQTGTDRYGYFATADLGISGSYKLPSGYGELGAGVYNGKGYTSPETDKYKDIAFRASLNPFPSHQLLRSLMVAGFTTIGYENGKKYSGLPKNRYGVLGYYSYSIASIGIEYGTRTDAPTHPDTTKTGSFTSVFGEVQSPWNSLDAFSIIWRYDFVDPNTSNDNDGYDFAVVGITYKPNKRITFVADYQGTVAETKNLKTTAGGYVDYDARYFIHMIVSL